ncbi:sorting nexin-10B-like [Neosynchiropus ocellatus]
MEGFFETLSKNEFVSICVRSPRTLKSKRWHAHIDYEICLHTNSVCFQKKTSCVRRRYSEFVWLRDSLEKNALDIDVPKLPPWNPFFSLGNAQQVAQRMEGLQEFLQIVIYTPLLLSDSRLHLFLQSELGVLCIENCVQGKTRFTVSQAIQRSMSRYDSSLVGKASCDSDSESTSSSTGLEGSLGTPMRGSPIPFFDSSDADPDSFSDS